MMFLVVHRDGDFVDDLDDETGWEHLTRRYQAENALLRLRSVTGTPFLDDR